MNRTDAIQECQSLMSTFRALESAALSVAAECDRRQGAAHGSGVIERAMKSAEGREDVRERTCHRLGLALFAAVLTAGLAAIALLVWTMWR